MAAAALRRADPRIHREAARVCWPRSAAVVIVAVYRRWLLRVLIGTAATLMPSSFSPRPARTRSCRGLGHGLRHDQEVPGHPFLVRLRGALAAARCLPAAAAQAGIPRRRQRHRRSTRAAAPPAPLRRPADPARGHRRDRPFHRPVDLQVGAGVRCRREGRGETLGGATDAAGDLAKGVTDAAGSVARLPHRDGRAAGRRCATAANGAPDCAAASAVLQGKGLRRAATSTSRRRAECPPRFGCRTASRPTPSARTRSFVVTRGLPIGSCIARRSVIFPQT